MTPIDKAIEEINTALGAIQFTDYGVAKDCLKEALQALRGMQERQSGYAGALKKSRVDEALSTFEKPSAIGKAMDDWQWGWNDCIDHLAARGLIGSVKSTTQLVDELRSRGLDVEIRADGINITPPPKNGDE